MLDQDASESRQATPSISVIIPAHNASQTLGDCLAALADQGAPGPRAELIVVDDRSRDETAQLARRFGATVLVGPGTGPAAARNLGAHEASGEILAFIDSDTVPCPDWLREVTSPFSEVDVAAVKGRYFTRQRGVIARFTQLEFEWKYQRLERAQRVDFVDTGNAAYRRSAFLNAGGFDEGFRSWGVAGGKKISSSEDVELAFRLASHGRRLIFNPRAAVYHLHEDDPWAFFVKKARGAYTRMLVYRRFPEKSRGDSYTPPLMAFQILLSGALAAAAALRVAGIGGNRPLLLTAAAFGATTWPVVRQALRSEPSLAPLIPALVFWRAFAQGIGMALALPEMARRKGRT